MKFINTILKSKLASVIISKMSEIDPVPLGVNGDIPDNEIQENIYEFSEIVGSSSKPIFQEKKPNEVRSFFRQYQGSQSSCVAHTAAKIATILYFLYRSLKVKFSPGFYYSQRFNKPDEGMWFSDIQKICKQGALLYDLLPTEGLTEKQISDLKIEQYHRDSADAFALPDTWVSIPLDFDTVASTIERTGKGIMLWAKFGKGEWFGQSIPKTLNSNKIWAHSVTAVDSWSYKGVQYIRIEDSAEIEKWQKDITREFFNEHFYLCRYPINFKFIIGDKPTFDGTIVSLQKCLVYEQCFPSNVTFVEHVGPLTKKAISMFQEKYGLPVTSNFDTQTVDKVKQLYS